MKHLALMTGILMLAIVARGQFVPATPQARKSLDDCAVMIHMAERPGPGRSQGRDVLSCGTGILIEGGRYLVTNSHVGGRETVQEGKFSPEDGKRYGLDFQTRAGAVEVSSTQRERRESDVAIYRVRSTPVEGIDRYVAFGDLKEGQPVWALSNAGCRPWTLSSGIIIALVDRRRNREVLDAMAKGLNEEGSFIRERYDK